MSSLILVFPSNIEREDSEHEELEEAGRIGSIVSTWHILSEVFFGL